MLQDSHLLSAGELEYTVEAGEVRLTFHRDGKRRPGKLAFPVPRAGIGGADLVVSPDERLAALCLYSGQSEIGLELFALQPRLRRTFSLPYHQGEGGPPKFAADSSWIAMLVRTPHHAWYDERDVPFTDQPPDGRTWTLDWAELYAIDLPGRDLSRTTILIEATTPPRGRELETWSTDRRLLAVTADAVDLKLPWGERARIPLPSPATIARTYPAPAP